MSPDKGSAYTHVVRIHESGQRIDSLLGDMEFIYSRSAAVRLLEDGSVTVDGKVVSKRYLVREGETIDVFVPPRDPCHLEPEDIPLDIRYEDDDIIILSKQADLVVHPAHGNWTGTLVHALMAHCDELGTLQGPDRPGIVHRLDKDTTGLMVVAKNDTAQAIVAESIKVRAMDRRYIALVHGFIAPDSGLIDAPLARDPKDRLRMGVSGSTSAKQAITTFKVLERFSAGHYDDGYTLLECKLYTGRTHQIRVHMSHINHPVVGDQLYGSRKEKADRGLRRQFLHSWRIELQHPRTTETIRMEDTLPQDLIHVLEGIAEESMGRTESGGMIIPRINRDEAGSPGA
ncbi:MAG: RluA family pseudouridine synthase [Actinobacteria bacterium]|nr:RluA family pseudouridine synthase [Actinomycetota bacterium]MCL5887278.1 RluA family pseudouridine synthase [Actinomycetota bacterium]